MSYVNIPVKKETKEGVDLCVLDYRKHHPEFDGMPISYNKIILEMKRIYLQTK